LPGCHAEFLRGLTDADALNLWRQFKITGSTEQLQPIFRSFENYPLLIRALAAEVATFRPAPRDFEQWHAANPDFDPTKMYRLDAMRHVLQHSLEGLTTNHRAKSGVAVHKIWWMYIMRSAGLGSMPDVQARRSDTSPPQLASEKCRRSYPSRRIACPTYVARSGFPGT
jgi:hypothetical protein